MELFLSGVYVNLVWRAMQRMSQDSSRRNDGRKEHGAAGARYIFVIVISGPRLWLRCQHFRRRKVTSCLLPWPKKFELQIAPPKLTPLSFPLMKRRPGKTSANTVIAGVGRSSFPNRSSPNQSSMVLIALLRFWMTCPSVKAPNVIYGLEIRKFIKRAHHYTFNVVSTTNSSLTWGIPIKSFQLGLSLSILKNKDFRNTVVGPDTGK